MRNLLPETRGPSSRFHRMHNRPDTRQLLFARSRSAWRAWLKGHYRSETEIWLLYNKKHTGKRRIAYNDAVEEALCFGWIDSTVKSIDTDSFAQRFTPRRPGRAYSQANRERLRQLIRAGRVAKDVLKTIRGLRRERFVIPPDILRAIRANTDAWSHFGKFSLSYRRIRIAYIEGARRRPEEFRRRLKHFVKMTAMNKLIGFGGIDKYY